MDILGAAMDWLSTMRLYIDHTSVRLGESDRDALAGFKRLLSAQYDSRFGYRFCARLRNYVVHQGLPIHTVAHPAESGLGPALRLSASTLVARYNGSSTVKVELLGSPEDIAWKVLRAFHDRDGLDAVTVSVVGRIQISNYSFSIPKLPVDPRENFVVSRITSHCNPRSQTTHDVAVPRLDAQPPVRG
jgi:hypothetical protein